MVQHQNSSGRDEIDSFFGNLRYRLDVWEKTKSDIDVKLAGDFNVFDYVNLEEPVLSRIIADLLKPQGTHGQRSAFLREFTRMLKLSDDLPFERAHVTCESPTVHIESASRRLDIKVNFGGQFGIGIENKPWAREQERQFTDYRDQLDREFKGCFHLVYLTRSDNPPNSISREDLQRLRSEGRFSHITFQREFSRWLTQCAKESQADKIRWFLRDLLDFVDKRLAGENVAEENSA